MVTLYLRGDQIATYAGLSAGGNGDAMQVTLTGVAPLGAATDIFRVVVTQVGPGQTTFLNGQFVAIFPHPDTDPPAPPLFVGLNPQHDQFQGRASSDIHQIFTSPAAIVFDVNGLAAGTKVYGPGPEPPRELQLPFDAFPAVPPVVPCIVAGTGIATARGICPVECLAPGDRVVTADRGLQPLRWVGRRRVPGIGPFAPVRFAAGTIGNGAPVAVSPPHRVLVRGWRAQLCFGAEAVLVEARRLVNGRTVVARPEPQVTYVHLLFDRHELVWTEGAWTESLHPAAFAGLPADGDRSLPWVVPGAAGGATARAARRCLTAYEALLRADAAPPSAPRTSGSGSPATRRRSTSG